MSELKKKTCCQDCKKGQLGQNETCKAKLLLAQLEKTKEKKTEV